MKLTPLHDWHVASGAKMVEFAGFHMPIQYTSIIEEHLAVRNAVGLFDVSHMGQVFLKGKDVMNFMHTMFTNDAARAKPGEMKYTHLCDEKGHTKDDMIFYRRGEEDFMVIPNASTTDMAVAWFKKHAKGKVTIDNQSDNYFCLALQGPKAFDVMAKMGYPDLKNMGFFTFKEMDLGTGEPIFVCASGYTGEKGFELVGPNKHAAKLWGRMMEAGKEFGIKPIGLGARDTLRLEKGFLLSGSDFHEDRTPLETGVEWAVKWEHDFIGKQPMLKQKEAGNYQRFVGMKMTERGVPRGHMDIEVGGKKVGMTTSGTMSPCLKIGVALGYVDKEYKAVGTKVDIVIRDKRVKAEVAKLPMV
jgi:aminomethyltransferase